MCILKMKLFKLTTLFALFAFTSIRADSQNVLINILTQNSGIVKRGNSIFLEVIVNNTDAKSFVDIFKINAQISVPAEIVKIDSAGHVLPTGWKIISNNDSTIRLSNGMDMIAAHDARTILIAMKGIKVGGPSTITGQLTFSNGESPGTAPGVLAGDNPADNSSTSTCRVIK